MKCIICSKQAVRNCDDMDLCLSHHLEKHEGQNSFIKKWGLAGLMTARGYNFCAFTKNWKKIKCQKLKPIEEVS